MELPPTGRQTLDLALPDTGPTGAASSSTYSATSRTGLPRHTAPPGGDDRAAQRPAAYGVPPSAGSPLDAQVLALVERERWARDATGALVPRRPEAVAYRLNAWYRVRISVAEVTEVLQASH